MKTTLPAPWLLILIAGVALWTDVDHLTRKVYDWSAILFVVSALCLAGTFATFALSKPKATKLLFGVGVGLAFLGTVCSPSYS